MLGVQSLKSLHPARLKAYLHKDASTNTNKTLVENYIRINTSWLFDINA